MEGEVDRRRRPEVGGFFRPHSQTILMMAYFGEGGGISLDLQLI